jgi:acetyltransferase-like isoleucine patch superfamily enzyme
MIENIKMGANVQIRGDESLVNLYGCDIGSDTTIGPFVEIQRGVKIGWGCKISSHSFICGGVTIGAKCFIGHGVMFTNDLYPTIVPRPDYLVKTILGNHVSVGSGATILPVWIGDGAIIGAGAVVVHDVSAYSIVVGNPARTSHQFSSLEERDAFVEYHYRNRLS